MKRIYFYILIAFAMNIGLVFSSNSNINKSILASENKDFEGSESIQKIYTKIGYNCYVNGDDSSFYNWCNASWHCTSGADFETCQDGPACASPCQEV